MRGYQKGIPARAVLPGGGGEQRAPERANQSAEKVPVESSRTVRSSGCQPSLIKQ